MAQLEKMIPFIILWETGVSDHSASNRTLFERARKKGVANDPADLGGATLAGVTIGTFREYCRMKPLPTPSVSDLASMSYDIWLDILKTMFWDRWRADEIRDQKVAEMLVDWVWASGSYGVTLPQKALGVTADGIVGPQTLSAVNSRSATALLKTLKEERIAFVERICKSRPANLRFRSGWLRRINALA